LRNVLTPSRARHRRRWWPGHVAEQQVPLGRMPERPLGEQEAGGDFFQRDVVPATE
jgi:hypothetical protein